MIDFGMGSRMCNFCGRNLPSSDLCGCDGERASHAKAFDPARFYQQIEDARERRAVAMPTERDCLRVLSDVSQRLRDLGWSDAIYCPKDGSEFDAIEFGSTGIHACHYSGEWPKGGWWVSDGGDLWPSHPVMYRKRPAQGIEAGTAETGTGSVHESPVAESDAPETPLSTPLPSGSIER